MDDQLQLPKIQETIAALEQRIQERFPGSGLGRVAGELDRLAGETGAVVERLGRPIWPLRLGAGLGILGIAFIVLGLGRLALGTSLRMGGLADLLQASEAALNEIVFLALAIFFLVTLENRVKRRIALRALHRLRSIVHIVDMHQLTKDPERLFSPGERTPSSPRRTLTRFELTRYLDYCSELFSLASKLAAMHVQHLNDPVVLEAVNDVETLAASLANKTWQKIMILDMGVSERARG